MNDYDEVIDYDARQFLRMRDSLRLFKQGELPLRELIANVGALIAALEHASPEVKRSLQSGWWILEEVAAQPNMEDALRESRVAAGSRELSRLLDGLLDRADLPESLRSSAPKPEQDGNP